MAMRRRPLPVRDEKQRLQAVQRFGAQAGVARSKCDKDIYPCKQSSVL